MRALVLLLPLVALGGCLSSGPDPTDPADAPEPVAASMTTAATAAPAPVPQVFAGVCQSSTGVTYGVPGLGSSGQAASCPFAEAKEGDLSALAAGLVEVVWTPGPSVTGAQLFIQSDSCWAGMRPGGSGLVEQDDCNIALAQGTTSPIRLEIPQDAFVTYGNDNLTAQVLADGATTAQAFTIYVTLFEAAPPAGYSAIPA